MDSGGAAVAVAAAETGTEIEPTILREAADWMVLLQSGEVSARERGEWERWRQRSAAHRAAWQRAEAVLSTFGQVPPRVGRETLLRLRRGGGRRQALGVGLAALLLPASWLAWQHAPWREWTADHRTAVGERRRLVLDDGTTLVLNTDSAVDLLRDGQGGSIRLLAGEILVTTGSAPAAVPMPVPMPLPMPSAPPRGWRVATPQGTVQPIGTRYSVRLREGLTEVGLFDGQVEISLAAGGQTLRLEAGQQVAFSAQRLHPVQAVDASAILWERGMLLARDMRLGELVEELGRHHRGLLRCDPAVAGWRVSGAFPLDDVPASLAMLEHSLPVRVGGLAPYWLSLGPR